MSSIAFNVPINSVSFGQISTLLLKTYHKKVLAGEDLPELKLFPLGGQVDLSAYNRWFILSHIALFKYTYNRTSVKMVTRFSKKKLTPDKMKRKIEILKSSSTYIQIND